MSTLITILHVIVCLFLMLTVLLQSGKGGGMGAAFGGGNAATVFGASGASSFLKRLTAIAGTIFISTSEMWTIPVGLKSLIGKYDVKWGVLMAGGVLALLPTAIMFAVMQRFVVEGLTAGAVKE